MTRTVGIARLSAYLPMYALALDDLARARGVEASGHLEPPAGFAGHFFCAGTERDRRSRLPTR